MFIRFLWFTMCSAYSSLNFGLLYYLSAMPDLSYFWPILTASYSLMRPSYASPSAIFSFIISCSLRCSIMMISSIFLLLCRYRRMPTTMIAVR